MRKNLSRTEIDFTGSLLLFTAGEYGCLITAATLKDAFLRKEVPGFATPITYVGDVVGEIVARGERLVAVSTSPNAAAAVSVYGSFDKTHYVDGATLHVHEAVTVKMKALIGVQTVSFGNVSHTVTTTVADFLLYPGRYTSPSISPTIDGTGVIYW